MDSGGREQVLFDRVKYEFLEQESLLPEETVAFALNPIVTYHTTVNRPLSEICSSYIRHLQHQVWV